MKKKKRKIHKKNKMHKAGVALLMVMSTITILTAILVNSSFQSLIYKARVNKSIDIEQARLNAEIGIKLSLTRLKIYREVLNLLSKNEQIKKLVPPQVLESLFSIPFIYPIYLPKDADIIQKTALQDFEKEMILRGEFRTNISKTSNKINVNFLRINNNEENPKLKIEQSLVDLLSNAIRKLKEKEDDDYYLDEIYPDKLFKELKYFINNPNLNQNEDDYETIALYSEKKPKFAPLSSVSSELNYLEGWNDFIIGMVVDNLAAHGKPTIDLNKIDESFLKLLVPDLSPEEVKEYFKEKANPENPIIFSNSTDFINFASRLFPHINDQDIKNRIEELKKSGVQFSAHGTHFKIHSTGQYNETMFKLEAIISIPPKPLPPPPLRPPQNGKCEPPDKYKLDKKTNNCIEVDKEGKPIKKPQEYLQARGSRDNTKVIYWLNIHTNSAYETSINFDHMNAVIAIIGYN